MAATIATAAKAMSMVLTPFPEAAAGRAGWDPGLAAAAEAAAGAAPA